MVMHNSLSRKRKMGLELSIPTSSLIAFAVEASRGGLAIEPGRLQPTQRSESSKEEESVLEMFLIRVHQNAVARNKHLRKL